ncbi:glycerophosphodiester phosphodiesterase family protein [Marinobacterium mangrovicola]|uniref:Glycerophosphoryl diester phosphodiesterase n=1 Tax=Marinobacterium mangrovicola TaxID=1476959 RepID=A0A4R1GFP2_9GAMM|nr:glycerophosphodiester phosphodiesterase family protein [Marinobacterium mangrovicola]TCK05713.1 glycerophosphoryl diester phosphodiesterase [Marinobacterium mangrovicola]
MLNTESERDLRPGVKPQLPKIIGHRAIASLAPENTLGAVREAARQGVKWVEMDVSLLADDTPVIHHDPTLERLSNSTGTLCEMQLVDLAGVNVAARFEGWGVEPVPTLREMLALLSELKLGFNLEIKDQGLDPARVVAAIAPELSAFDPAKLVISSFSEALLQECQRQLPELARGLLLSELEGNWSDKLESLQAFSLHSHWRALNEQTIAQAKAISCRVLAWTVNDIEEAHRLLQLGVDSVITDIPQQFGSVDDRAPDEAQ